MLNRVILIGRLTRDPELRYTADNKPVATFTLAVERNYKGADGQKEADFINIIAWRALGECCANYLSKGKLAAVEGRLQVRSYEGKDGGKRTVAEVIAENVQFLSPASKQTQFAPQNQIEELPFGGTMGDPVNAPKYEPDVMGYEEQDLPF